MSGYCIYDPQPEQGGGEAIVIVPKAGSWTKAEAEEYANLLYPDEGSGDTKVVKLVAAG